MRKLIGFSLLWIMWVGTIHATLPELLDLKLVGPKEAAQFEPNHFDLLEGETYLLVIENPFDTTYSFEAPTLPSAILTQYIQGSPSVTKTSVQIAPRSKVQWLFRTKKGGSYSFAPQAYGMRNKHQPGTITIMPLVPEESVAKAQLQEVIPLEVKVPTPEYVAAINTEQVTSQQPKQRKQPRWGGRP